VTTLADCNHLDPEVPGEKRPRGRPSVTLLEAANGEKGLLAISPAHARAFEPLGRQRLARRFNHPTANGQALRLITGVVHAVALILKVGELGDEQFAAPFEPLATHLSHQSAEFSDGLGNTAGLVSHNDTQAFVLGTPFDTLVAVVTNGVSILKTIQYL